MVLVAALLHSIWNAVAKAIPDRLAASSLISLAHLAAGSVGILIFPMPAVESWPYLAASTAIQSAYLLILTASYKHGDFSQVYPLARGSAVVLIAGGAGVFLGETLTPLQSLATLAVAGALIALAFVGSPSGKVSGSRRGAAFALLTGAAIAGYSLVDGTGARESGSPLGYAMWLFALQGVVVLGICWLRAPDRSALLGSVRTWWRIGMFGGVLSLISYAIVVWAQTLAPLALVSALRESSVLLAGVIGFLFFKERFSKRRAVLTAIAVAGIATLQLG